MAHGRLAYKLRFEKTRAARGVPRGKSMLRAEIRWLRIGPTLKMEGELVGQWAEQARCLVTDGVVPKGLIVDLNDVSCVDTAGERLLSWWASLGAVFAASTVYAIAICERLGLPTARRITARRHESEENKSSVAHSHVG